MCVCDDARACENAHDGTPAHIPTITRYKRCEEWRTEHLLRAAGSSSTNGGLPVSVVPLLGVSDKNIEHLFVEGVHEGVFSGSVPLAAQHLAEGVDQSFLENQV